MRGALSFVHWVRVFGAVLGTDTPRRLKLIMAGCTSSETSHEPTCYFRCRHP